MNTFHRNGSMEAPRMKAPTVDTMFKSVKPSEGR
ncbi:Uncharacterised protein [Mycobacteroides abscessus subsp. abscessus]|nr:Uncharacterised protein [Mycobacteroides abscessus subsp. abscessus]